MLTPCPHVYYSQSLTRPPCQHPLNGHTQHAMQPIPLPHGVLVVVREVFVTLECLHLCQLLDDHLCLLLAVALLQVALLHGPGHIPRSGGLLSLAPDNQLRALLKILVVLQPQVKQLILPLPG